MGKHLSENLYISETCTEVNMTEVPLTLGFENTQVVDVSLSVTFFIYLPHKKCGGSKGKGNSRNLDWWKFQS